MWLFIPSACVPESAASTWDLSALERLAASATSSGKHFRPHVWSRRCKEASWPKLLSGVTYEPSMLQRGVAAWISSWADTRASHSHTQGNAEAQTILGTSGLKCFASTENLEPATCSARTSQDTFRLGSPTSLPTLPRSGRMSSGACSARPTLERRTRESGCFFWPTATVMDAASACNSTANRAEPGKAHAGDTLTDAVRMWNTPTARDHHDGACRDCASPTKGALGRQAPRTDVLGSGTSAKAVLNPPFVEALMGFPIGWTDCEHSEMPSCRK